MSCHWRKALSLIYKGLQPYSFKSHELAKHICDKMQYGEARFSERIKLSIRLAWCKFTRTYSKKNSRLTSSIKEAEMNCLKDAERKKLEDQFEKELRKL